MGHLHDGDIMLSVVLAKRSVDELCMHYFHKLSLASGGFRPIDPMHQGSIPILRWGFCPETPNLPTPGKKILQASMYGVSDAPT